MPSVARLGRQSQKYLIGIREVPNRRACKIRQDFCVASVRATEPRTAAVWQLEGKTGFMRAGLYESTMLMTLHISESEGSVQSCHVYGTKSASKQYPAFPALSMLQSAAGVTRHLRRSV
jgi:hypothetical protein